MGNALIQPTGPLLLHYTRNVCPVYVGQPWTKNEIIMAVERGLHKLALVPNEITMMYYEVEEKVRDGFAEIVYLNEIKHLLGTSEWSQLKKSLWPWSHIRVRNSVQYWICNYCLKIGLIITSANENTVITVPHHSMWHLGSVLPRLIEAVANAPEDKGNMVFSKMDIKYGYW